MIIMALAIALVILVEIKTINYGRWSARQGNRRGAIGLYIIAMLLLLVPTGVYVYNRLI